MPELEGLSQSDCSCPYPNPRPADVHRGCPIHGDVLVPRDKLRLLYECAAAYDRRIPEGNGSEWAQPFHDLFGSVGADDEHTPRGRD